MASVNPRRSTRTRQVKDADNALTLKTMSLRKSSTFHSPTSPPSSTSDQDFVPPSMRRSHTILDDAVDSHRRRMALIVDDFDKTLCVSEPTSSSPKRRFCDDSLPLPRGFLEPPVVDPAMAKDEPERPQLRRSTRRHSKNQPSDSGLGTSIASTQEKRASSSTKASAITRSAAASSAMDNLPGLSKRAQSRIQEHILRPLLAKPSLKDFRPIVLDIPRRITDKEIICLRDLEKTLVFMAPERTKTADLYLDFCLTSIRCIQRTVDYLKDRDHEQIRPRDRPYTNLYFMDLEEQIRQYATQLATVKDKISRGEETDDMDVDPSEELRLHGGVAKNGRTAEMIRVKKDGRAISLATGELVDLDEESDAKSPLRLKRSLSATAEDEEEIMRSMARRKKNAPPEEAKQCREPGCNKEFKRPCDLTKHEKTHSRPWKCPVKTCKYHEYGWPTEKEMDRHHNDKHTNNPTTFECLYKPCPYKSKRESNCKQHMEKAHGWHYVRTKTNGKKTAKSPSAKVAQSTPALTHISTPQSNSVGLHTPPEESVQLFPPLATQNIEFPQYPSHDEFVDTFGAHPMDLPELNDMGDGMNIDMSPLTSTPSTSPFEAYGGFQDASRYTLNDEDLYTAHAQLPTPNQSAFEKILPQAQFPAYATENACQAEHMPAPHISPIGQGNAVLFTPKSLADVDEGFEDFPTGGFNDDFQLYPTSEKMNNFEPLFGEVPSTGMGFSQPSQEIFSTQMDWSSVNDYTTYHGGH